MENSTWKWALIGLVWSILTLNLTTQTALGRIYSKRIYKLSFVWTGIYHKIPHWKSNLQYCSVIYLNAPERLPSKQRTDIKYSTNVQQRRYISIKIKRFSTYSKGSFAPIPLRVVPDDAFVTLFQSIYTKTLWHIVLFALVRNVERN